MEMKLSLWYHPSLDVFFGSLQPCGWLTGKVEAKKTSNTKSSHNFAANSTKLSEPSGHPKQCVIRWFWFASVHVNQVFFFANGRITIKRTQNNKHTTEVTAKAIRMLGMIELLLSSLSVIEGHN